MTDSLARTGPAASAALAERATPTARRLVEASITPNTRRVYSGAHRRLDTWLDGRPIDDQNLAAYLAELHDAGRAPASAAMAAAAACFRARLAGLALVDAAESRLIRKCKPVINVTCNPNVKSVKNARTSRGTAAWRGLAAAEARGRHAGAYFAEGGNHGFPEIAPRRCARSDDLEPARPARPPPAEACLARVP